MLLSQGQLLGLSIGMLVFHYQIEPSLVKKCTVQHIFTVGNNLCGKSFHFRETGMGKVMITLQSHCLLLYLAIALVIRFRPGFLNRRVATW